MPSARLPVVVIGDIGHRTAFHVGDEAMFDALVPGTAAPSDWIAVSADPSHTTERTGVPAIDRIGFAHDDAVAREARLADVLGFAGADAVPDGDPAGAVLAALDRASGLLVTGGGNLSSSWPDHVYERVALIELAARRGLPVVVTGQTLGPALRDREPELLAGALAKAALVGVREPDSLALAAELGVPAERLTLQPDDALLIGNGAQATGAPDGPWIAVTVPSAGVPADEVPRLEALAGQLAQIARATGAAIGLVPHEGSLDGALVRDLRVDDILRRALVAHGTPVTALPLLAPAQAAAVTHRAELVVSARYHPLVFGLGGGVPCLGIHSGAYTRVKTRGVLGFAGLEDWSLPLDAAVELLAPAALELWERRAEVRAHLDGLRPAWRTAHAAHAARIAAALAGEPATGADVVPAAPGPQPAGSWAAAARIVDDVAARAEARETQLNGDVQTLEASFLEAERYALSLRAALDEARDPRPRKRRRSEDAAPAGPGVVRLSDLRHDQVGDVAVASMLVESPAGPSGRVHLRRHGASVDELDQSATPFLPIAATLATPQGCDAHVDGPVDETARAGAEAGGAQLARWFAWRAPVVTAAQTTLPATPAPGRALFFSRGLDSMASFVRQRERLDALISMSWDDPPYRDAGTEAVWRGTVAAVNASGVPLIRVSTDARTFLDPVIGWNFSHGPVLGALGLLLTPEIGEALIAGAFPTGNAAPAGTHPDLDHLWSSSALRFETEDGGGGRNEKAAIVGPDPFASQWLSVCWEVPGERNCGRCCKCLLTMTNFKIAGCLDAVTDCFDGELSPEAVLAVAYEGTPTTPMNADFVLERLADDDPLRPAWELMREVALERDLATQREALAAAAEG